MALDEVGQELLGGDGSRRRIDDTVVGAGLGHERIHLFALRGRGSVSRDFGCEPDAHSFRDSPGVEEHPAQDEDLEPLA